MKPLAIIITGVSGSGKTTIGKTLATALQFDFYDGDDFHPPANIAKMSAGIPLNDGDRIPWLSAINVHIRQSMTQRPLVLACSALKESYRQLIARDLPPRHIFWVHLQGNYEVIYNRMTSRAGHYMAPEMLRSQFDAYEQPSNGLIIDINEDIQQIIQQVMSNIISHKSEVGLIGMGVMGTSLARNIANKGFRISLYNQHAAPHEVHVALRATETYDELRAALPFDDLTDFIASLHTPRKIILMVSAGKAVDAVLEQLRPLLAAGDIIIDGGNSHYQETEKRQAALEAKGIIWLGAGISGGEAGALHGPAIMPGGSREGFEQVKDILYAIAAKNQEQEICCAYVGGGGAGHFVKMVHNGIEYAEMQLIAEIYSYLRYEQNKTPAQIAELFSAWNEGDAESYLLGITVPILQFKDSDGQPLIDKIADVAGNKGTGSWTTIAACELGVPTPSMTEALFARYISAFKKQRTAYNDLYHITTQPVQIDESNLFAIYLFSRIMNHQQGLQLIQAASEAHNWQIDLSSLLTIWTDGCIIRSKLLHIIRHELAAHHNDIMQHPYVQAFIQQHIEHINNAVARMAMSAQAFPVITAALVGFKQLITDRMNTYLIQAQRDYFGAHRYQRTDDPDGKMWHTTWE
ncbi:MAG TPA: NADP-dependent phosphogluconate dehydrogenase [Saprospiraceae bacterium]|nr:NADP-dependent phosphogluconate dehydrogenase [Saprospiraceae bacterium]HMP25410.1 NADP-dependent phosphogluconate dehydrogenase [Saprospiraceae bacterium]